MKKARLFMAALITAGSFLGLAGSAAAQTIGFKVGPTWSTIATDDDEGLERLMSLGGGGFVRFGMMGLSVQTEVLAITKGYKASDDTGEGKFKLDYIEVPLMARFGLGASPKFAPYVMAGPSFAYNYGCEISGEDAESGVQIDLSCEDFGLQIEDFDIGLRGAAGFEFRAGPGAILIEGSYTHGLANISDAGGASDAKNRTFGLMAGYAFTLVR